MYGMAVVARAHDDLEAGPLGGRAQLQRVAPDLDARAVDERGAARVDVVVQLRHRELDVVEHAVATELLPQVEEDVLVRQRRAQLRRGHRALDGHDRARLDVGGWGSHPIPPPSRSLSDARSASHSGPASERAAWIKTVTRIRTDVLGFAARPGRRGTSLVHRRPQPSPRRLGPAMMPPGYRSSTLGSCIGMRWSARWRAFSYVSIAWS